MFIKSKSKKNGNNCIKLNFKYFILLIKKLNHYIFLLLYNLENPKIYH